MWETSTLHAFTIRRQQTSWEMTKTWHTVLVWWTELVTLRTEHFSQSQNRIENLNHGKAMTLKRYCTEEWVLDCGEDKKDKQKRNEIKHQWERERKEGKAWSINLTDTSNAGSAERGLRGTSIFLPRTNTWMSSLNQSHGLPVLNVWQTQEKKTYSVIQLLIPIFTPEACSHQFLHQHFFPLFSPLSITLSPHSIPSSPGCPSSFIPSLSYPCSCLVFLCHPL